MNLDNVFAVVVRARSRARVNWFILWYEDMKKRKAIIKRGKKIR